jgi:hypothetical protein
MTKLLPAGATRARGRSARRAAACVKPRATGQVGRDEAARPARVGQRPIRAERHRGRSRPFDAMG